MAEYYDASEVIICETSSEAEASDESGLSDITTTSNSEPDEGHGEHRPTAHLVLWFYRGAKMWIISLIIVFSSCPQPLLLLSIGPV